MLTIDDFVMLGKTVPEPNADGRIFVCSAGYSPTLRTLIRVYPLARHGAPPRWSVNTVSLERNNRDHRIESFKLTGDRRPGAHHRINSQFSTTGTVPERHRSEMLRRHAVESIAEANQRRLSLAVIHPEAIEVEFDHNPESPDSPQEALFDMKARPEAGAKRFPYIPRLRFRDATRDNRLMLRDWGVYELMRKNDNLTRMSEGERRRFLSDALHLDPTCSLLIGNLNNQRTAWLVISVLRNLRGAPSLFDHLEVAA